MGRVPDTFAHAASEKCLQVAPYAMTQNEVSYTLASPRSLQTSANFLVLRHRPSPKGYVTYRRYPTSMHREPISTNSAPGAIGPYSQAVRAEGSFLFLSGQIPLTAAGDLVKGTIAEQTNQCMSNIGEVLKAAGLTYASIVKTTIFLSSMEHFAAVNEVYGSFFTDEPPARSTVAVAGLPRGVDVEIESIAVY